MTTGKNKVSIGLFSRGELAFGWESLLGGFFEMGGNE